MEVSKALIQIKLYIQRALLTHEDRFDNPFNAFQIDPRLGFPGFDPFSSTRGEFRSYGGPQGVFYGFPQQTNQYFLTNYNEVRCLLDSNST